MIGQTADGCIGIVKTEDYHRAAAATFDKSIHILNIHTTIIENIQQVIKSEGLIRYFDGNDIGHTDGKTVFAQNAFGVGWLIDDQAQDTEIGGIGQLEGPNIDSGLTNRPRHLGEAS